MGKPPGPAGNWTGPLNSLRYIGLNRGNVRRHQDTNPLTCALPRLFCIKSCFNIIIFAMHHVTANASKGFQRLPKALNGFQVKLLNQGTHWASATSRCCQHQSSGSCTVVRWKTTWKPGWGLNNFLSEKRITQGGLPIWSGNKTNLQVGNQKIPWTQKSTRTSELAAKKATLTFNHAVTGLWTLLLKWQPTALFQENHTPNNVTCACTCLFQDFCSSELWHWS